MKIGLVCPYSFVNGGGVQECVFAMRSELSKRGHKVYIITPQHREQSEPLPKYVRELGRSTDVKYPFRTNAQVSVSVDSTQVDQLLEDEKFDVLHFHEPWVPLLSRQLLTRSTSKNIATFHAKLPDTVMSRTIERVITPYTRSVLKYLDVLTAVSDLAATYVQTLTDQNVQIIPNGIDLKKYKKSAKAEPRRKPNETVLFIGRLERRKGLTYLLKAMAHLQVQHPDISLIVAGDGPDKLQLQKKAADLGVNATFLGRVDEKTKLSLLNDAQLFCSPPRYGESFGIVLLEAMAVGLPVVAGNNPGYTSVLKDTGKVSLVNPSDTTEFARRIDLMLHDDDLRRVWQKWASKTVADYDYSSVVDQYEKLYQV